MNLTVKKMIDYLEEEIIKINCGDIDTRSLRSQNKNYLELLKKFDKELEELANNKTIKIDLSKGILTNKENLINEIRGVYKE